MPKIKILYWNIENFGNQNVYRPAGHQQRCDFIAQVAYLAEADIICVQEVKQSAVNSGALSQLQESLCRLEPPFNNWYYEHIKGAISTNAGVMPPYSTRNHLMYDAAHHEGYAIYWNQNLAKFKMLPADPVTHPGGATAANTQGELVRGWGLLTALKVQAYGIAFPAGSLRSPGNYQIPAGTTHTSVGIFAGQPSPTVAPLNVPAGAVIQNGTRIGYPNPPGNQVSGITVIDAPFLNVEPTIIPARYTLTADYTLPASNTVIAPQHCMSQTET